MSEEKDEELFSSVKAAENASNDGFLKAVGVAVTVGVLGVVILAAIGIKGGIIGVMPTLLALGTYLALRNEAKTKNNR